MDNVAVEKKWRKIWNDTDVYKFDKNDVDNKHYVLEMFSYPSGAKLHIGHWYNFGLSDSYARFKKMQGYNVFQPMGFDAFGLPAENYAIKTGIHPKDSTLKNIEMMEEQLKRMGAMFDWKAEVVTCNPNYYRWTQWIFLQMYKHGYAYRKNAPVNWCNSCNTVLANEQVVDGVCERCGTTIIRKDLTQWFFKITAYAEELLSDLAKIDWPEKTKAMQANWIGKSVGGEVEFALDNGENFRVFTTRADTLYGVSYVVLAPEHPLVDRIMTDEYKQAVDDYRVEVAKSTEIERMSTSKPKTGVFTGAYATNPINNEKVPVWIADYVLYNYGTGCVMGVASHDERDYEFAIKHNLKIERVVAGDGVTDMLPFCELGTLVNSGEFNGLNSQDAIVAILTKLDKQGKGCLKTNYRLRDWLISRQRYWGAPIPIVYCDKCGIVPVEESQLPVELPYNVNFTPDGTSPLNKCEEFVNTTCPKCGGAARREVDTMDTFVCSSWYFLRYCDNTNEDKVFDTSWIDKMMPVDKYIGGAEHACMHLLYARFFTKALRDMGYLHFDEPFQSLVHQGTILGTDGNKMSKSKGNVVSPDEYITQYGSDVFRCYLGFGFKYIEGGPWSEDGIKAVAKWLERVERCVLKANDAGASQQCKQDKELNYVRNYCIDNVTKDYQIFSFNTAIARMMELTNAMSKYETETGIANKQLYRDCALDLVKLLSPLAPHQTEELWEQLGQSYSIIKAKFPIVDTSALVKDEVEIVIQINAKIKGKIVIASTMTEEEIKTSALNEPSIVVALEGKTVVKVIVVPSRLVNIIIK